ncbi:aldehyde dehydrogenase family protein [Citricoccus nitrophenolicus]|uniref:aldehyde dehydrogenase family protein n=1 Tax=Citricoccus nitrophenolicus TaxID=863575 RepID=UPI0031E864A5
MAEQLQRDQGLGPPPPGRPLEPEEQQERQQPAVNRILVQAPVYDDFVAEFTAAAKLVKFGDPAAEGSLVGPVVNDSQLEGLKAKITGAQEAGATVAVSGQISDRVVAPHVFADVTAEMEIAREEIFGPMVAIPKPQSTDPDPNR